MTVVCTSVTLGSLLLDGATADAFGIVWSWTRLDGWESPSSRVDQLLPAGRDGSAIGSALYGGRGLTLAGIADLPGPTYPDTTNYWRAIERLNAASNLAGVSPGTLIVDEPDPKQAEVYRSGPLRARPIRGYMRAVEFEIPLVAPDWRRLSTTVTTDSTGTVTNNGDVRSDPTITVTGAAAGPIRVTSTTDDSKYVEVNTSLAGGESLVIDMGAMTATKAGVSVDDLVVAGSRWWSILPGSNTWAQTGGGTESLTFRDAWL